ncbi:MAG: AraC family transcriptional regulator [Saccharospirillaceae bacterium]|nr:AraC family transcriptional regulator [Pseudomonadales bacterium]NRB79433.1 AraC family transcriptional regulator [Saccharospirillaceae bacterium]
MLIEDTNPNDIILMLFDYLDDLGIDPKHVCDEAGVAFDLFQQQNNLITIEQEQRIWLEAIAVSKNTNFGLHLGKNFHAHAKGHILITLFANSPNMQVALQKMVTYHGLLHGKNRINFQLIQQENFITYQCKFTTSNPIFARHFVESLFSGIVALTRHLSKSSVAPERINFKHNSPDDLLEHQTLLKAPIYFNQQYNELIFAKQDLLHPISMANPEFFELLEKHITTQLRSITSKNVVSEKVKRLLAESILTTPINLTQIAKKLAMSPRTLQGKLKTEGQSFSAIRDQVRKSIAIEFLKDTDEGICDIAFLLGFSEQSTFSKAFKQWTGLPPKQYRLKFQKNDF